jgi:putative ABC transport system permease protein
MGRTALTLAAIVAGVSGLVLSGGFVHDIFDQLGEAVIHSQSGHLQVSRTGFQASGSRMPERYSIADPRRLETVLESNPEVRDVTFRTAFSGLLNNGRSDVAIIGEGIDPEGENRLGTQMSIIAGRRLRAADRDGALLGDGVARALKVAPGDRVTMLLMTRGGATNTIDLEVIGVFRSFSKDYDARAVRIPIAAAQQALETTGVNTLVVSIARTEDTQQVAENLRKRLQGHDLEVSTWEDLNDFYAKTVKLYDRQFAVLRAIILFMVLLSVANSVNMSLFERVPEFGTMRALGNNISQVVRLVLLECLLLGVLGAVIGVGTGIFVAGVASSIGIPMPPPPNSDLGYTARIALVPSVIFGAFAVGVMASVLAGVLAAVRMIRIPIVDALRQAI